MKDKERIVDFKKEMAAIAAREKILSSAVSSLEVHVKILKNALLVSRGVPSDVALLRTNLVDRMRQAKRKDILISRKEELEKEIPERKKQLQKLCKHQFVIGRESYESHDMYESNWVLGCRLCVVCGLGEIATGKKIRGSDTWREGEDEFPTLNGDSERVIDKHGIDSRNPLDIWQPLEEVLKHFVDKRVYEIVKT